ncbi:MAG: SOS response-associated peptidase [Bacteroidales bacterium]|jgi:putative SOS response-associated peptidase YedK|nr:SOS response-associated peptidase [Bacteroidales bacterium]
MCFYYCLTKKNPTQLIKNNVIHEEQLNLFDETYLVNGFEHPAMPVITGEKPGEIQFFRWGLIPYWVKDKETAYSIRNKTLNAKSETIFEKASFKHSIRHKRCLILCSGFFEWQKVKGKKYPYYISLENDEVFVFGGIWSSWTDTESGEIINTYAVITVEANELVGKIHNTKKRMPLILEPEKAFQWIDKNTSEREIRQIMQPLNSSSMKAHTIKKFMPVQPGDTSNPEIIAYYHYPELLDIMAPGN